MVVIVSLRHPFLLIFLLLLWASRIGPPSKAAHYRYSAGDIQYGIEPIWSKFASHIVPAANLLKVIENPIEFIDTAVLKDKLACAFGAVLNHHRNTD